MGYFSFILSSADFCFKINVFQSLNSRISPAFQSFPDLCLNSFAVVSRYRVEDGMLRCTEKNKTGESGLNNVCQCQ